MIAKLNALADRIWDVGRALLAALWASRPHVSAVLKATGALLLSVLAAVWVARPKIYAMAVRSAKPLIPALRRAARIRWRRAAEVSAAVAVAYGIVAGASLLHRMSGKSALVTVSVDRRAVAEAPRHTVVVDIAIDRQKTERARRQLAALDRAVRERVQSPEPLARVRNAARVSGSPYRDCSDCPALLYVPAGELDLARDDEAGDVRTVKIWPGFWVSVAPVSQRDFGAYLSDRGVAPSPCNDSSAGAPCITQSNAASYARWLTARTGYAYRLASARELAYVAQQRQRGERAGRHDAAASTAEMCARHEHAQRGYTIINAAHAAQSCDDVELAKAVAEQPEFWVVREAH